MSTVCSPGEYNTPIYTYLLKKNSKNFFLTYKMSRINQKYATDLLCLFFYALIDSRYNNSLGPSVETLIYVFVIERTI